jgi:pyruvate dehydrogenase E2 component (dihydrolipoamide acetyltransferase)
LAIKNLITPDFGGSAEVTVIEILTQVGATIQADTPIVTLESDKATMEIPASDAGTVKEIKVKVGDKVSSGSIILVLDVAGSAATTSSASSKPVDHATQSVPTVKQATLPKQVEPETNNVHAGPGVRRMARELGVNLGSIPGSGPKQRILKEDVQAFVQSPSASTERMSGSSLATSGIDFAQFGEIESLALSRIKRISGKNLQRNWTMIPHVTQFGEADITALEDFRQAQKTLLEKQNIRLTPLVFIMKAVVTALQAFPHFNASLDATGEILILKKYFHIGVAVDTPHGLVVPVIRAVDKKGMVTLAEELAHISEKARRQQLMPQEMQGGCFSISSLGGIGGTAFTPIINSPEVAILGVSKAMHKPLYQEGAWVPRLLLPLSLSYDHRVIDGAEGARFMVHLTELLSDIRRLLL